MIHAALLLAAMSAMTLESTDFRSGGTIPQASMAVDCGGKNRTPALQWHDPPPGTKSFALIVHDPDAPIAGGFYHWVLYDIPETARGLASNQIGGATLGAASTQQAAYYGPCPPPGPAHHYIFTLYALDVAHIDTNTPLAASELERRIDGHVLATATLKAVAAQH
jgi:Raf kinase inhibitor-like YbhB/YbcL family protein